jgi:hypothetical protein
VNSSPPSTGLLLLLLLCLLLLLYWRLLLLLLPLYLLLLYLFCETNLWASLDRTIVIKLFLLLFMYDDVASQEMFLLGL